MSREFGRYGRSGYFHDKIKEAARDARDGEHEITNCVGAILKELAPVAYAISSYEDADWGEDDLVSVLLIQRKRILKEVNLLIDLAAKAQEILDNDGCSAHDEILIELIDGLRRHLEKAEGS